MKVKFKGSGPDDETKVCTMFGVDFFRGIETDVSELDDHARGKLAGNSHFDVTQADVPKRRLGRPRKDEGEPVNGDVQ